MEDILGYLILALLVLGGAYVLIRRLRAREDDIPQPRPRPAPTYEAPSKRYSAISPTKPLPPRSSPHRRPARTARRDDSDDIAVFTGVSAASGGSYDYDNHDRGDRIDFSGGGGSFGGGGSSGSWSDDSCSSSSSSSSSDSGGSCGGGGD